MTLVRGGAAVVAGVATFYFGGWFGGALISILIPGAFAAMLSFAASAWCGVLVARRLWRSEAPRAGAVGSGVFAQVVNGALIVGGVGFCAGFFGPMIFAPQANQGPLLGIFITGPLGVLVGAVGGFVYSQRRRPAPRPTLHRAD